MNKKILVAAAASMVLVIVAILALLSDSSTPRRMEDPLASDPGGAQDPGANGVGGSAGGADVATDARAGSGGAEGADADVPAGVVLHGVVTEPSGAALPGARVMVSRTGNLFSLDPGERTRMLRARALGRASAPDTKPVAETRTDASGEYRFPIAELPRGEYRVLAVADGMAPQSADWRWVPETSRIDIPLRFGLSIQGVVLDPDGRPVSGAMVQASIEIEERRGPGGPGFMSSRELADRIRTDGDGRFRLNVSDRTYLVSAEAPGFASDLIRRVPPGDEDVVLRLGAPRGLKGVVSDEGGNPLSGVELALYLDDRFGDGEGGGFGRGRGGRGGRGGPGGFGRGGRGGFGRGGRGGGGPAGLGRQVFTSAKGHATSGSDGDFVFGELVPGLYTVVAQKDGYVPAQESVVIDEEAGETVETALTLPEGRILAGRVLDDDSQPVPGAFVVVGVSEVAREQEFLDRMQRQVEDRLRQLEEEGNVEELTRMTEMIARREEEMVRRLEQRTREPVSVWQGLQATETDAAGTFRLSTLGKGKYTVSVEADQFVTYREAEVDLTEEDRAIEIRLDPGLGLRGRVVSSVDESPVVGAKVSLERRGQAVGAKADDSGEYRIGGLVDGDAWSMQVDAKGYSMALLEDVAVSGETQDEDFVVRLDPSATVRGTVVDGQGQPVDGARVRLEDAPEPEPEGDISDEERWRQMRERFQQERRRRTLSASDRTDANGEFELTEVNPSVAMQLSVTHPDFRAYASDPFEVRPGESVDDLRVQLSSGARLRVAVRSPEGLPVASVRVSVVDIALQESQAQEEQQNGRGGRGGRGGRRGGPFGRGREGFYSRTTDAAGVAVFSGLNAGAHQVAAQVEGFQPFRGQTELVEEELIDFPVELLLENVITGKITSRTGEPVEGARLRARQVVAGDEGDEGGGRGGRGGRGGPGGRVHESWGRSAADGTFRIGSLGEGPYDLSIDCRGFASQQLPAVAVNSEQLIVLERLAEISGWVLSDSSVPIQTFEVRYQMAGEGAAGAGEARGPGGQGPGGRGPGGNGRGGRRRFDDPTGAFQLTDLRPGKYTLEFLASGFTGRTIELQLREGEVVDELQIVLPEGLAIAGLVRAGASMVPVSGAEVFVMAVTASTGEDPDENLSIEERRARRREEMERRRERRGQGEDAQAAVAALAKVSGQPPAVRTEVDGSFRLAEVEPGRYLLIVNHEAFLPWSNSVEVSADRPMGEQQILLQPGETVTGRVTWSDRSPAAGVTVMFRSSDGTTRRTVTDDAGRYELSGFLLGSYTMQARSSDGQRSQALRVQVKKGSNRKNLSFKDGAE